MTVLLKSGRRVCNDRCHYAKKTPPAKCRCICGGQNHNKQYQAEQQQKEAVEEFQITETPAALPADGMITGNWASREVHIGTKRLSPGPSQTICNHSPDGFNWSYGGSGPAQLALAIMLKFLSRSEALECYGDFKWGIIAHLPDGNFSLPVAKVQEWISEHRRSQITMALETTV